MLSVIYIYLNFQPHINKQAKYIYLTSLITYCNDKSSEFISMSNYYKMANISSSMQNTPEYVFISTIASYPNLVRYKER